MQIRHVSDRLDSALGAEVVTCINAGGTIIFPTETVYGIGAGAENDTGIAAVFAIKERGQGKPLALHIANVGQAEPFVADWPDAALRAISHFWPGPLAIIVQRRARRFEKAAAGYPTISLRCPDHALARELLLHTGPLAATSANRSGQPAFTGLPQAMGDLPVATLLLIAGPTALQRESTIMDCSGAQAHVLRWGALERAALEPIMGTLESRA